MRIWNPISYRGGNQTRTGAPMRPQCPRPARPENHHDHFRLIPSEFYTLASSCVRIICFESDMTALRFVFGGPGRAEPSQARLRRAFARSHRRHEVTGDWSRCQEVSFSFSLFPSLSLSLFPSPPFSPAFFFIILSFQILSESSSKYYNFSSSVYL